MKKICFTLQLLLFCTIGFCQSKPNDDYISWSATRKLTINDFIIKTKDLQTSPSFAQFNIGYQVNGMDFMSRNFNKKVGNYFIKSASWIDTTFDIVKSIRYQQTLFDIAEIYARQFRKDLKAKKNKFLSGTDFIKELNAKIVSDFSKRRIEYDTDTKYATEAAKQSEWETEIQVELNALKDFGIDYFSS